MKKEKACAISRCRHRVMALLVATWTPTPAAFLVSLVALPVSVPQRTLGQLLLRREVPVVAREQRRRVRAEIDVLGASHAHPAMSTLVPMCAARYAARIRLVLLMSTPCTLYVLAERFCSLSFTCFRLGFRSGRRRTPRLLTAAADGVRRLVPRKGVDYSVRFTTPASPATPSPRRPSAASC
jgi:hypothetical protein